MGNMTKVFDEPKIVTENGPNGSFGGEVVVESRKATRIDKSSGVPQPRRRTIYNIRTLINGSQFGTASQGYSEDEADIMIGVIRTQMTKLRSHLQMLTNSPEGKELAKRLKTRKVTNEANAAALSSFIKKHRSRCGLAEDGTRSSRVATAA